MSYYTTELFLLFMQKLTGLLLERELAGGALDQDIESERVAELDDLWWQMTDKEQEQAEVEIAKTPDAPKELHLVDVNVILGCSELPRSCSILDGKFGVR